jgi:Holliday junction resolvase RusA-like endonuclease
MTMTPLQITVHGQPAPQGSKRAFAVRGKGGVPTGRVAVIESSHDRVKSWRQAVVEATVKAIADHGGEFPLTGPLNAWIVFTVPKPASAPKRKRTWPSKRPDLSKLLRSTEDALTDAGAWSDDAQVVTYAAVGKVFAGDPGALPSPGARIEIWPVGGLDD